MRMLDYSLRYIKQKIDWYYKTCDDTKGIYLGAYIKDDFHIWILKEFDGDEIDWKKSSLIQTLKDLNSEYA